ncbi:MAG: site-specific DNA-methyltransferase [Gammaproteobacteria bacterium]|nr:site-specific DNA-methyltransferase [Gammaproteobacteria bacterium]MYE53444.1 site-specific DNA-methyltransferase [Gammaproteobacteria bacterium]MYF51735.1 site-specific DNA-methyltransferase [Gammaproteobacteria bacterium]MYK83632.1 site-specific DNA-methyltransferase [Gammaproteobacteria bacterium]
MTSVVDAGSTDMVGFQRLADFAMVSPNGGSVADRRRLCERFAPRLSVNPRLNRRTVSYQGNKAVPGFRWLKYKEGFSRDLVLDLIQAHEPESVLDPFAGTGTTPLVAASCGVRATGVEIMPVGVAAGKAVIAAAEDVPRAAFHEAANGLLAHVRRAGPTPTAFAFPHVRITRGAFPENSEAEIAKAREFNTRVDAPAIETLLNLACMSVLEECSYTRKDGQYLRWDYRSGRSRTRMDKGEVAPFAEALEARLFEMLEDFDELKSMYGGKNRPELITGSSLEVLRTLPDRSFDMVITSPPYANRYDYTRTYALELAWLGYGQQDFIDLRQRLLTATVENKEKRDWLNSVYTDDCSELSRASCMYQESAVHEVLSILREKSSELSNRNIIRLIEGYFFEMAVIVAELGRVVRPGGVVLMVNDNVQYHGEEVPVDFLLADYAERSGFTCANIWMLPRGKGNSSQQMARFGRREIRKCVYRWVRSG